MTKLLLCTGREDKSERQNKSEIEICPHDFYMHTDFFSSIRMRNVRKPVGDTNEI